MNKSHKHFNQIVNSEETKPESRAEELPDNWWHRVYLSVILATVIVIFLLWSFSRYFSS